VGWTACANSALVSGISGSEEHMDVGGQWAHMVGKVLTARQENRVIGHRRYFITSYF